MSDLRTFGDISIGLARNPLGIIALFIVLVYGFAALVTTLPGSLDAGERLPLVYFLVGFPVLVLGVFAWLVSRHSTKLFGPGDYRYEENYVQMQMIAVASLATARAKDNAPTSQKDLERVVTAVRGTRRSNPQVGRSNELLWVDDRPENNAYERQAFEAIGLRFTIALSTDEAMAHLESQKFAAIISDMGRKEGPREGYVLLDRLRASGDHTPIFFYARSNSPEHKRETKEHGGQGCTNNAQELFEMVTKVVIGSLSPVY